jgi:hypothetical protein
MHAIYISLHGRKTESVVTWCPGPDVFFLAEVSHGVEISTSKTRCVIDI